MMMYKLTYDISNESKRCSISTCESSTICTFWTSSSAGGKLGGVQRRTILTNWSYAVGTCWLVAIIAWGASDWSRSISTDTGGSGIVPTWVGTRTIDHVPIGTSASWSASI